MKTTVKSHRKGIIILALMVIGLAVVALRNMKTNPA